jgi:hypothetical protein
LRRNTARHDHTSTSQPPSTGPSAVVSAPAPAQVPMARPRSASGKDAAISARLPGTISAPPTPCAARAAMREAEPGAAAQPAEASANTAMPARNTRRRPKRSPAAPPTSTKAPSMRV